MKMSSGLKGYLCSCRGTQLRLNLNGSNILVVVVIAVVEDFIACFLIVSKHTLSLKIFRNFSIFMHVWIFFFQACYRKSAGSFVMTVCVQLTMPENITPKLFHVLLCSGAWGSVVFKALRY